MRVALADGTVAKSGGKVIKNVAGYDLGKLFTGSYGTLGAILEVAVRLHPLPPATATAVGHTQQPAAAGRRRGGAVARAAGAARAWTCAGPPAPGWCSRASAARPRGQQAEAAEALLREPGLEAELADDDEPLWQAQRDGQRSPAGLVVRVSALQTDLRAAWPRWPSATAPRWSGARDSGLSWLRLDEGDSRGCSPRCVPAS